MIFDNFQANQTNKYLEILPQVTPSHTNLLLVDKTVLNYQLFVDSCNNSTYPLVYNFTYKSDLILNYIIKSFSNISRIAVVCHGQENVSKFLDNEPFDSKSNFDFIKKVIANFNIKNIDFLGCNTLKYSSWTDYYNKLNSETGITVGASNDNTGNIKYGGDWVLESTGNDVKLTYWTNLIDNYSELLALPNNIITSGNYTDDQGIIYTYNTDNKSNTAYVSGYDTNIHPNIIIPETITVPDNNITYSVQSINNNAFASCIKLTSVTIGNNVKTIDSSCFMFCSSLTNVIIGTSVITIGDNAFYFCTSLESVIISDSVTTIGISAFASCTSLININIPDSVTTIDSNAFASCTSLESVTIGTGITIINTYTFQSCKKLKTVTVTDAITFIELYAFDGCESLTSIINGNNVTNINLHAFYNCKSLINVPFWNSVNKINYSAFYNCTSLTSIVFGNNLNTIGSNAFCNCLALKSILFVNNLSLMGPNAFANCINLDSIYVKSIDYLQCNATSFYYMNKLSKIYVTSTPQTDTFLGYDIVQSTNTGPNNSNKSNKSNNSNALKTVLPNLHVTKSSINILSDYYYLLTNQLMQRRNNICIIKSKTNTNIVPGLMQPYKNPINIYTNIKPPNLKNYKLTYTLDNNTKYNITKSQIDTFDNISNWIQLDISKNPFISISPGIMYNNISYDKIYINQNGSFSFGNANTSPQDDINLDTHFKNKQLSIYYSSLSIPTIFYITTDDYLLIHYNTIVIECYVKLYFVTGVIEVNYTNIQTDINTDLYCIIGLSDGSGTDYIPTDPNPTPVEYTVTEFDKL